MAPKNGYNKANYQKNTNLVVEHEFQGQHPKVQREKTDGRIGSVTPPSYLKGGLSVDNNSDAQPFSGPIGSKAPNHMSASHSGQGTHFSPRVKKARAMAKPNPKPYANPVNVDRPSLKRVKPD